MNQSMTIRIDIEPLQKKKYIIHRLITVMTMGDASLPEEIRTENI